MQGGATVFDKPYLLLIDKEHAEKATRLLGVPLPRQIHTTPCRVLKGELVTAIPPEDRVQQNDGLMHHNYRTLTKDSPATFYHDDEELDLSPLTPNDYDVLAGIRSTYARYQFFIEEGRLDWANKLKKGDKVFVEVPVEGGGATPGTGPRAPAVVRYVGPVQTLSGIIFGVEIKDRTYFGWGTSDGVFQDEQHFRCREDCGLFVSAEKLFPAGTVPAGTPHPAQRGGGKQAVREKRREIIRQIRKIQPQAGKNLKDVEVPQSLFQLAKDIVRDPEASLRFNKVAVYELLLGDLTRRRREPANAGGVALDKAVPVLEGWKLASISLFRYALNLVLAPNRAEFKKMKLSTSFYVYNISRHLHHAEEAFKAMGYRATDKKEKKETQDLVYDGDVKLAPVLETATDLLVMHEEVVHLQGAVTMLLHSGRREVPLKNIVHNRRLQFVKAQQGSGIAPSGSPHPNPPPAHFNQPSSQYCNNPPLPTRVPPPQLVSGGVGQNAPVSTRPALPSNVVHSHEWMHQQAGQKRTDHDYANMSRVGGNIMVMNTTYSHQYPNQTPQFSSAATVHGGTQSTAAETAQLYGNIPGPPQTQQRLQRHHSHYDPPAPPFCGEHRRASQPTTYQNYPPTTTTYSAGCWDAATYDPTFFTPPTAGTIVSDYSGVQFSVPSSPAPPRPHPALDQTSGPPSPTARPVPKPRSNVPSKLTAQEDVENINVHRLSIEARQQSPGGPDSMIDNLPPPITDFTTPIKEEPSYDSGIPGFMSDLNNPGVGGSLLSISLRESGPKGLRDSELALEASSSSVGESPGASSNPPLTMSHTTSTSSESSMDLYGSGPTLPNLSRQQSSAQQMMREQSFPPLQEEREDYDEDGGLQMTAATSPAGTPTITTQGSLDAVPRELPPEQETSPRKSYAKSQSTEIVEGDWAHQDRGQQSLRFVKSGSNLQEMASESEQTRNLDKPQPAPRRSGSRSPPGSGGTSPTASPKLAPRNRSTHEQWTPTAQSRPFPPPTNGISKSATLPRQAKSVEVEPRANREMPRYSSGSDLAKDRPTDKPLPFKPLTGKQMEPETPVLGYVPEHLQKLISARQQQSTHRTEPSSQQPLQCSHTHPQNNCREHSVERERLREQLQKEQEERREREKRLQQELLQKEQQRLEAERLLQEKLQKEQEERIELERLQKIGQQQRMETERRLQQEKQEKEEAQKQLRNLQLQLEQQKKRESKPHFQQKSVAVVSPNNTEATPSLSKPGLDKGGEGAHALRAQQYGEGKPRERANADASQLRHCRRPSANKQAAELETIFTEVPTTEDIRAATQKVPDMVTHIDLENTWVCDYCTNLNADGLPKCEVCERPDPRISWLCLTCKNINPNSLHQCKTCNAPKETAL